LEKFEGNANIFIQCQTQGYKIYCIDGLLQTTEAILGIVHDLFNDNQELSFVFTSRFNQDPLENLFACVRANGGNCRNPTVHQFNTIIAKLMSLKIHNFSSKSNCESDTDIMLPVKLDSIIYEPNENKVASNDETVLFSEIEKENQAYFDSSADDFVAPIYPLN